jgi:putative peptide zinc metalloprotease protein
MSAPVHLPALRPDLQIHPGAPLPTGEPGWVIHDPVRHRFFQIGREALDILASWRPGTVEDLVSDMRRRGVREPRPEAVAGLSRFLEVHDLALEPLGGAKLAEKARSRRHHWLVNLVHNYLFFTVPLVRPQRFLDANRWIGTLLFSPLSLAVFGVLGAFALVLVARRWDMVLSTGLGFLNLEGALAYAITLAAVKSVHELGHATMATRHGVRVPSMGIAFMVLAPFLYSDLSDAWRLRNRRPRFMIDVAGVLAELILAVFALLAWVFLPEGLAKAAAFLVATTSILSSLLLNLNPLMRFDGYHMLADAVGIPNLQTRSMAVGRWRMREWLFGIGAPAPEAFAPRVLTAMAVYAWVIWVYRFFLFLGIAILVYHMAFKVLGVILFLVEIVWFIARPIAHELQVLWTGRSVLARKPRAWATAAVLAGLVTLAFVPLSTTVVVPAMLSAKRDTALYPPQPARVEAVLVQKGQPVAAGDPLFVLSSPDLETELRRVRRRAELLELRLARTPADGADRAELQVIQSKLSAERAAELALARQLSELVVNAPFDGVVEDIDPALRHGDWVNTRTLLGRVISPGEAELRGYVEESDMRRISPGARGRFIPEEARLEAIPVTLASMGRTAAEELAVQALASVHEGSIPVAEDTRRRLVPGIAIYPVTMVPEGDHAVARPLRGLARLEGAAESYASRLLRRVVGVLIRESGA